MFEGVFKTAQWAVLGLLLLTIGAMGWYRSGIQGRIDLGLRWILVLMLTVAEAAGWIGAYRQGIVLIPLQLCDLAALTAVIGLLSRQPWACRLAYFWAMAGSLQALLTPDLPFAFPHFWWLQFHASHGGIVLAAAYLAVTGRVRPTLKTVLWVLLMTNLYALAAGWINWRFGTNYGYLAAKPAHPSLLDWFGPWPWYILGMELAGTLLVLLCYLPFVIGRKFFRPREVPDL